MKTISRSLTSVLVALLATACATTPALSEEGIVRMAREHVADTDWTKSATYDVQRGAGGVLSTWIVVVSCTTCVSADGSESNDIIVLGMDRNGNVLSRTQP
jgi:hypothetical protein